MVLAYPRMRHILARSLIYALTAAGALVVCLPLAWMVLAAISPEGSVTGGGFFLRGDRTRGTCR